MLGKVLRISIFLVLSACSVGRQDRGVRLFFEQDALGAPQVYRVTETFVKNGCSIPAISSNDEISISKEKLSDCGNGELNRVILTARFEDSYEGKVSQESLATRVYLPRNFCNELRRKIVDSIELSGYLTISNVAGGIWRIKSGKFQMIQDSIAFDAAWVPIYQDGEASPARTKTSISIGAICNSAQ